MLIEINVSQIRISDSKREKVCALYPYFLLIYLQKNRLLAQTVRRSPPTAPGVQSSHLGHCMWVSWGGRRNSMWVGFSRDFLPFSSTINFIPPFPNAFLMYLFYFISLSPVTVRQTFYIGVLSQLIARTGPVLDKI